MISLGKRGVGWGRKQIVILPLGKQVTKPYNGCGENTP